jgi:hypothetical protein
MSVSLFWANVINFLTEFSFVVFMCHQGAFCDLCIVTEKVKLNGGV